MDQHHRDMRVSDADREVAVEQLRQAMSEGRLSLVEFDDRLERVYRSVTYADVDELFTDLPRRGLTWHATTAAPPAVPEPPAGVPAAQRPHPGSPLAPRGPEPVVPAWLKALWIGWGAIIAISLVVWTLTRDGDGDGADDGSFWPQWVMGPPVAIILAISAIVVVLRRSRRAD